MATWRKIIHSFDLAESTNSSIYQKITPTEDVILKAIRAEVAQYDNPTWTSVTLKLYAFDGTNVRGLIASSLTTKTKAQLFSLGNGFSAAEFEFSDLMLKSGTEYAVVMNFVGYTPAGNSYVGWSVDWPETIYRGGFTPTFENGLIAPLKIEIIGEKL